MSIVDISIVENSSLQYLEQASVCKDQGMVITLRTDIRPEVVAQNTLFEPIIVLSRRN